ncbi:hypothetical protein AAVH_06530 [Aphelenchoides avenae]|nr:hypothetical protein AAVH_06530 [Aphelenchus avenae]
MPQVPVAQAVVRGVDCFTKAFSVVLVVMNLQLRCSKLKSIPMHRNLKILLSNFAAIYVVHAAAITGLFVGRQAKVLFSVDGCISPWLEWQCVALFGGRFATTVGFSIAHFTFVVERTVASYYADRYEKSGSMLSACLMALTWTGMLVWTYYIFCEEDLYATMSDCAFVHAITVKWTGSMWVCLAIDVVVCIFDFALVVVTIRQRQRNSHRNYSLRKSYQLKENQLTTKIIFPCSLVHTCAFAAYLAINSAGFALLGGKGISWAGAVLDGTQLIMSVYIYATLLFFYWIRRRVSLNSFATQSSQDVDEYFQHFQQQIAYGPEDGDDVDPKWLQRLTRFLNRRIFAL